MSTGPQQLQLEKQLQKLHTLCSALEVRLNVDRVAAGRVITELKKLFKHGEWMPYSEKLYARLQVSRKTAERYVEAYEQVRALGAPLIDAAKKAGLDIDRIPVREKLIEVKHNCPTASPTEIVNLTNLELQKAARVKPEPQLFDLARITAYVSNLRFELTKIPRIGDSVSNPTELETLMKSLRTLVQDAQSAADKIENVLTKRTERAA